MIDSKDISVVDLYIKISTGESPQGLGIKIEKSLV